MPDGAILVSQNSKDEFLEYLHELRLQVRHKERTQDKLSYTHKMIFGKIDMETGEKITVVNNNVTMWSGDLNG